MKAHPRGKKFQVGEISGPEDAWVWLGVVIFIWQEKFPHLTQEEVFAQVTEALASSRVRHWLPRLGTSLSRAEMNEIDSRVKEITKRQAPLLD